MGIHRYSDGASSLVRVPAEVRSGGRVSLDDEAMARQVGLSRDDAVHLGAVIR